MTVPLLKFALFQRVNVILSLNVISTWRIAVCKITPLILPVICAVFVTFIVIFPIHAKKIYSWPIFSPWQICCNLFFILGWICFLKYCFSYCYNRLNACKKIESTPKIGDHHHHHQRHREKASSWERWIGFFCLSVINGGLKFCFKNSHQAIVSGIL